MYIDESTFDERSRWYRVVPRDCAMVDTRTGRVRLSREAQAHFQRLFAEAGLNLDNYLTSLERLGEGWFTVIRFANDVISERILKKAESGEMSPWNAEVRLERAICSKNLELFKSALNDLVARVESGEHLSAYQLHSDVE